MSDYINNKIIEYINENFTNITTISIFQNEIDNIINNLENTVCSIPYPYPSGYNINGINKIKSGIDFSYLIPNLFRSCYSKDSLKIPNICPTFIYINKSTHFFPLLESENIIKSFLYFNFPVNINSYNSNNNFLEDILKFKYQLYKKKYNTTYGSYTNPLDLYNEIYSSNSMLSQLLTFSNYLSESNYAVNNSVNINTFNIPWDFTYNCLCYSGFLDYTYITGNNNYDYNITNSYANLIYTINNLNYNIDNIDIFLYDLITKNNFNTLLKYVKSVFEDILIQLQYYISGKNYCEKDYMNISYIPNLLNLYKKFYNNQISTYKKSLKSTSIVNINPQRITIKNYSQFFDNVYTTESGNYYIKYFLLNGINGPDSIMIFSDKEDWKVSTNDPINYYYFYLNINYPSGVQLYNIYLDSDTPYKTYQYLDDFVIDFNAYFQSYKGTGIQYNIESDKNLNWGNYPSGGEFLYGLDYPNNQNICYINSYYYKVINQDKLTLNYIIYLSLQTYSPYSYDIANSISEETSGYGVALIIYQNFND